MFCACAHITSAPLRQEEFSSSNSGDIDPAALSLIKSRSIVIHANDILISGIQYKKVGQEMPHNLFIGS